MVSEEICDTAAEVRGIGQVGFRTRLREPVCKDFILTNTALSARGFCSVATCISVDDRVEPEDTATTWNLASCDKNVSTVAIKRVGFNVEGVRRPEGIRLRPRVVAKTSDVLIIG